MAFRLVNSLRMQAVRATFAAFPAARKRSSKALSIGLSRAATRALLDSVARTGTRPPPNRPAAPERATIPGQRGHADQGGQPLAAQRAQLWQVDQQCTGADRATTRDAAEPSLAFPPPWTRPQRRVEVVVQRCPPGVEPGDRGLEVRLQPWGCPPKTFCAAVRRATNGRRRASSARRSSAGASGRARGGGRTASATWAQARASSAAVLATGPVALATSRAWRGLPTATGSPAAASAATTAPW